MLAYIPWHTHAHMHTHTHNHFTALWILSGTTWVSQYQKNIHPLTPIMVINHPLSASSIYYDPWHPLCSIYVTDSLLPQSLSKFSLVLPLGLAPYTSYFIHFFTQSLSSFCSTCPYHRNLSCCSTEIMSSNPSSSLNPLLGLIDWAVS